MITFVIFLTATAFVTCSIQALCYLCYMQSQDAMAYANKTVNRNRIETVYQN